MIRGLLFAVIVSLALATVVSADDVVVNPGHNIGRVNDNGVVWISPNVGYLIYQNTAAVGSSELVWSKTVNGGTSWSVPVLITSDVGQNEPSPMFAIWYDRWTFGDMGTKIHIAFLCSGFLCPGPETGGTYYTSLDTSTDALGSVVNASETSCCSRTSLSITKSVAGSLYIFSATSTNVSGNYRFHRSINNGSTWTIVANAGGGNFGKLVPVEPVGVSIGIDDVFMLASNGNIYQYSRPTNSWGTAAFLWSSTGNPTPQITQNRSGNLAQEANSLSVVTNPTVGEVDRWSTFYGVLTGPDLTSRTGFYVLRNSPTTGFINVTPVFTSLAGSNYGALMYDDPNSRLYAVWVQFESDEVTYKFSDDFGDTWSSEQRFDLTSNDKGDLSIARTVTLNGGRLFPIWEETPALVTELDSVVILTGDADEGTDQDFENRLDRFVDGMGFRGTSGGFWFASLTSMFLAGMMMLFRAPIMVTAAVVGMWSTLMTLVGFLPFGVYLSAVTVFGIILIFLILKTLQGSESDL